MSYKRIGDYIQPVNIKNEDGEVEKLLGVNLDKVFITSVANLNGVDMTKYKIIKKGQFGCKLMSVGRDKRLPISRLVDYDKAIISSAYFVFEVTNENELLPEYLMMWFSRPESDRFLWFLSGGDIRGRITWEDLCTLPIKIPTLEKQQQIVAEYNTVTNRIHLNNQLNQKLEATAQALYKHWFVDFEFPNQDGKPYKTSGGKMVTNEELDKVIPVGWKMFSIGKLLKEKGYIRGPFGSALKVEDMKSEGVPIYEQQHILDDHRNFRYFISEEKHQKLKRFEVQAKDIVISCSGVNLGKLSMIEEEFRVGIINQALLILRVDPEIINPLWIRVFLESKEGKALLIQESGGSAIPNIAKREIIQSIPFPLPPDTLIQGITENLTTIESQVNNNSKQNNILQKLQSLLLAKMTQQEPKAELV